MSISRILHRRSVPKPKHWYMIAATTSQNPAWAFDRFRIEGNLSNVEVAVITDENYFELINTPEGLQVPKDQEDASLEQIQPFRSGGGWSPTPSEHDFQFDLSGVGSNTKALVIKGLTEHHKIWQVYAYPTGYSATRGKNAEIEWWDFNVGKIQNAGSDELTKGRLRFDNQFYAPLEYSYATEPAPVMAQEVNIVGASRHTVEAMIGALVLGGKTNGVLTYTNKPRGYFVIIGNSTLVNYNTLISRGWVINGPAPDSEVEIAVNIISPFEGEEVGVDFVSQFEINGITSIEITNISEGEEVSTDFTVDIKLN